jgi:hypothetical protein
MSDWEAFAVKALVQSGVAAARRVRPGLRSLPDRAAVSCRGLRRLPSLLTDLSLCVAERPETQ